MSAGVYILLGTNLGDRMANLTQAKQHISSLIGAIITQSSIYKTSAWGNTDQPDFYNQIIEVDISLKPEDALNIILGIEHTMGRVRDKKWGPRIIDIDILLWKNQILKTAILTIPHPGLPERKFTLLPLAELAPDLIHPALLKSISQLLQECADPLPVEKIN